MNATRKIETRDSTASGADAIEASGRMSGKAYDKALEKLHVELKFKQTKIEALNFEIARMTHWRLCSSSMVTRRESSWDTSALAMHPSQPMQPAV